MKQALFLALALLAGCVAFLNAGAMLGWTPPLNPAYSPSWLKAAAATYLLFGFCHLATKGQRHD